MKNAVIIITGILFFAVVLIVGFNAFVKYSLRKMHKKQTVAENVQITSDWLELTPEKPLETTKLVQNVMLSIENYQHDIGENDFGNIKLTDGTNIKPEVQIIDEKGNIYYLRDGQRLGNDVGFSLDSKIHGTYSFPKDVTFKTIKIRSDNPFRCRKVVWYDYDLK